MFWQYLIHTGNSHRQPHDLQVMSDLQKQLDLKQKEFNDLKASFDEYMSSSKELELELESSLDEVCICHMSLFKTASIIHHPYCRLKIDTIPL